MEKNENYSFNESAQTIMDEAVVEESYLPICKAVCGALCVIGLIMLGAFFRSEKARKLAKKQAAKAAKAAGKAKCPCLFFKRK